MGSPQTSSIADAKKHGNAEASKDKRSNKNHHDNRTEKGVMTPTSPSYPPMGYGYVDAAAVQMAYEQAAANGFDPNDPASYAYVYPLSPQFGVHYYPEFVGGYQSYPGSPSLHPQSPTLNPNSPPFTPSFLYQQGIALPPTSYMLPPPSAQAFPMQISSPALTGVASAPSSPPAAVQRLPAAFVSPASPRAGPQHKRTPSQSEEVQYHTLNIYVRGLEPTINDDSFLELCSKYGKVTSSKAIIEQKTGECKGYGFAMYETQDEAQNAIDSLNQLGLQVAFAKVGQESFSSRLKSLQDESSTNIYISNLPITMNEQQLEELFQPYHTVSNRILRDPQTGISRGVGFARMSDRSSAIAVIEGFNSHTLPGCTVPLQVRFADSPAQKTLKGQTARKRVWRARDFQAMPGFAARPVQMPVTPETMLGFTAVPAPYFEGGYVPYPGQPRAYYPVPSPTSNTEDEGSPVVEDSSLAAAVEQKLNLAEDAE